MTTNSNQTADRASSSDSRATSTSVVSQRVLGIDVARAIAICGMALVHFTLAAGWSAGDVSWAAQALEKVDGRPAAMFMILAGIGLALRTMSKPDLSDESRVVARRGWFFLVFGYLNLIWWEGDILRVYGISFLVASGLLAASKRVLYLAAAFFSLGFMPLVTMLDFERNWEWETLTYHNLWTLSGACWNLFYNGFRSVFPWTALLFVGILVGRLDLRSSVVRRRVLVIAATVCVVTELVSWALVRFLMTNGAADPELVIAVAGTTSLPPMPLFLVAASSFAIFAIVACVMLAERWPNLRVTRAFVAAGQMAFTWYIAHIGFVILWAVVGEAIDATQPVSIVATGAFCVMMLCVSLWYRKRWRWGPLEFLLRRVAG